MERLMKLSLFLVVLALAAMPVQAATVYWTGTSGDPFDGPYWYDPLTTLTGSLVEGDQPNIGGNSTAVLTTPLSTVLGSVWTGDTSVNTPGTGTLNLSDNAELNCSSLVAGLDAQVGTITMTGGKIIGSSRLYVGYGSSTYAGTPALGTYTQSGGTAEFANGIRIAQGVSSGTLNLSGGTLTTPSTFYMGYSTTSTAQVATLNVTGGTLNAYDFDQAWYKCTGNVTIDGGTVNIGNDYIMSGSAGSIANTELKSGTLNVTRYLYLGRNHTQVNSGATTFTQSGGVLNVNRIYMGNPSNHGATYNYFLTGGTVNANRFYTYNGSKITQSGGVVNIKDYFYFGANGTSNAYNEYYMTDGAVFNAIENNSFQVGIAGDSGTTYRRGRIWMNGDDTAVNIVGGQVHFGLNNGRGYLNMGFYNDGTTNVSSNTSPEFNVTDSFFCIGNADGSSPALTYGRVDMRSQSVMNVTNSEIHVGIWERGDGAISMSEDAVLNVSGKFLMLGDNWSGANAGTGVLNLDDRAAVNLTKGANLIIANLVYGVGTVNMGQVGDVNDVPTLTLLGEYDGGRIYLGAGGTAVFNQNAGTTTAGGMYFSWTDAAVATNGATLNLNGGVFATSFINTEDVSAKGTINFNGGILRAASNSVNFLSNDKNATLNAYVSASGAIIDTNGFGAKINHTLQSDPTIVFPALDGGLQKIGAGQLVLAGSHSYTGPTNIVAGTLALAGMISQSEKVVVNGGANFHLQHMGYTVPALQMLDGSKLSLSVSSWEGSTALYVTGALDASGTGTKTIAMNPQMGDNFNTSTAYVIDATSGSVNAANLTAVSNVRAYDAAATVVGNTVQIQMSSSSNTAKSLTYVPGSSNVWDINTTANWTDGSMAERFYHWDSVNFAAGMGNLDIAVDGVVMPNQITVETGAGDTYTLGSGGAISHAPGGLTKNGEGTLVLDTGSVLNTGVIEGGVVINKGNDFSGNVTVTAGTLKIGANAGLNPLGNTSGGTTIANGATLDVGGHNLGDEMVEVYGAGVGGNGAIVSSSTNTQYDALKFVTITGDNVTFGGVGRWDIRNGNLTAPGGPYTLTKKGINQIDICNTFVDNNLGDINIEEGTLYFEGSSKVGDATKTITVSPGATLSLWYTGGDTNMISKNVVVNAGTMEAIGVNSFDGTIEINTDGKFTSTGSLHFAMAAGKSIGLTLNDNAAFTMEYGRIGGGFATADNPSHATITLNGSSVLKATAWANIGESYSVANVALHGTSQLTAVDHFDFGYGASTNVTVVADGSSVIHSDLNMFIGVYGANAQGKVTMNENSAFTVAQDVYVGRDNYDAVNLTSGLATLELNNNALATVGRDLIVAYHYGTKGILDLNNDSTTTVTRDLRVGRWGGDAILNVNDNAHVTAANIVVGYNWGDTVDQLGNAVATVNGAGAVVNVGPGVAGSTGYLILGGDAGKGTWTQAAGHTTVASGVVLGQADYSDNLASYATSYSIAELNLNGGTLTTPGLGTNAKVLSTHADDLGAVRTNPVTATVNFNGGVLQASAASADFFLVDDPAASLTLNVLAGGTLFDTNGFDATISQPLVHSGEVADGGLKKLGDGTLTLTGALSYNGPTVVNQGTLTVAALTNSAQVYVASSATLNATSIVADTLTIGGPQIVAASAAAVPEPSTFVLLALAGLALVGAYVRRK